MSKQCPVCGSKVWNYDVVEYGTGWKFCGNCFDDAKRNGFFEKLSELLKSIRRRSNV